MLTNVWARIVVQSLPHARTPEALMNVRVKRVTMGTEKYAKVRYDIFVVARCMSTFIHSNIYLSSRC